LNSLSKDSSAAARLPTLSPPPAGGSVRAVAGVPLKRKFPFKNRN